MFLGLPEMDRRLGLADVAIKVRVMEITEELLPKNLGFCHCFNLVVSSPLEARQKFARSHL
jgi:hypothetical protein